MTVLGALIGTKITVTSVVFVLKIQLLQGCLRGIFYWEKEHKSLVIAKLGKETGSLTKSIGHIEYHIGDTLQKVFN